jgi:glycosidase
LRNTGLLLAAILLIACGGGGAANPGASSPAQSLAVPDLGSVAAHNLGSQLPEGWQRGPFMQIHVRAYQDSNGDGVGDLRGLMARLDYLQSLGVRGLWLLPVNESADRDHGYAVRNYRAIEPDYGTIEDMRALLDAAHQRGIGVILDHVINHASSQHPLFLNARSSPGDLHRQFFVWQPQVPSGWLIYGRNPWYATSNGAYFAPFWSGMPDFNWRHTPVRDFHHDNLRYWLNLGVDGFRFDAVGHLVENGPGAWDNQPENHGIMAGVREVVQSYSRRYMVCESPGASRAFAAASSCGSAFAFDLKDAVLRSARGNDPQAVQEVANYFVSAPAGMATFLANHDRFAGDRIWHQMGGDEAAYRMAASTYLMLPGTPFIYYGEEIGMAHARGLQGDQALRAPMSWSSAADGFSSGKPFRAAAENLATHNVALQKADPQSLLSTYRRLIALRNAHAPLHSGAYREAGSQGQVLAFERYTAEQRMLVLVHYGRTAGRVTLNLPADSRWRAIEGATGTRTADAGGRALFDVQPQSLSVYEFLQ